MLLKRIEGKTLNEALARVRTECGEDALLVETRATAAGYLVVAAEKDTTLPPRPRGGQLLSRWTRGFHPMAERAESFGLSHRILAAVEHALLGTKVNLSRAGDPALPALCVRVLEALIKTESRFEGEPVEPPFRVTALVGPTGVGKTTTLAKLAARAVNAGQRVAIVTADTYRMAAVEQLRAYADLLDVPLHVTFTPQDLRRAVLQCADADRVFIDTTGRSPLDRDALRALGGTLAAQQPSVILCISAGTRARDCEAVLDAYDEMHVRGAALTKWDETVMPGEALSAVVERGLPVCHVTVGQEVPADIVAASPALLAAAAFDFEPKPAEAAL
jgi:flagellar biosynthesis GTPase FlhF